MVPPLFLFHSQHITPYLWMSLQGQRTTYREKKLVVLIVKILHATLLRNSVVIRQLHAKITFTETFETNLNFNSSLTLHTSNWWVNEMLPTIGRLAREREKGEENIFWKSCFTTSNGPVRLCGSQCAIFAGCSSIWIDNVQWKCARWFTEDFSNVSPKLWELIRHVIHGTLFDFD